MAKSMLKVRPDYDLKQLKNHGFYEFVEGNNIWNYDVADVDGVQLHILVNAFGYEDRGVYINLWIDEDVNPVQDINSNLPIIIFELIHRGVIVLEGI